MTGAATVPMQPPVGRQIDLTTKSRRWRAGAVVLAFGAVLWLLLPYRVYILGSPVACGRGPLIVYSHPTDDDAVSGCYGEAHHRIDESSAVLVLAGLAEVFCRTERRAERKREATRE